MPTAVLGLIKYEIQITQKNLGHAVVIVLNQMTIVLFIFYHKGKIIFTRKQEEVQCFTYLIQLDIGT